MHERFKQVLPWGVLLAMLAVVHADIIFLGRTFLISPITLFWPYHDIPALFTFQPPTGWYGIIDGGGIAWTFEALSQFINDQFRAGAFPLWNPHQGIGAPLFANGHSGVLDPLLVPLHLVPESLWLPTYDATLLVRYFIALVFTYLLLRRWDVSQTGALLGAAAFAFTPYFLWESAIAYARGELLVPLLLYTTDRLLREDDRRVYGSPLWHVLAVGLLVITGFPGTYPLHFGLSGLYALMVLWRAPDLTTRAAKLAAARRFALATALGIGLGLVLLVPFVEYFSNGINNREGAPSVIDNFPPTQEALVMRSRYHPVTVLLTVWAVGWLLTRKRLRDLRFTEGLLLFWAILAGVMLLPQVDAFGTRWIHRLPILNLINIPRNFSPLVGLGLALAAGLGLDLWRQADRRPSFWGMLVAVPAALTVGMDMQPGHVIALGVTTITIVTFYMMAGVPAWRQRWALMLVLVLLVGRMTLLKDTTHFPRVDPFTTPPQVVTLTREDHPRPRLYSQGCHLRPNYASVYGIDDIRYLDASPPLTYVEHVHSYVTEREWDRIRLTGTEGLSSTTFLENLGVTHVVVTKPIGVCSLDEVILPEPLDILFEDPSLLIYRQPNTTPRTFVAFDAVYADTPEQVQQRLVGGVRFREVPPLLDQGPAATVPAPAPADASGTAEIITRTANTLTIQATLSHPGMLVALEQHYPGWRATVDGDPRPIYRVNGLFRGVALDAGTHTVTFRYLPTTFLAGAGLSGVSAILTLVWLVWRRRTAHA